MAHRPLLQRRVTANQLRRHKRVSRQRRKKQKRKRPKRKMPRRKKQNSGSEA
jgi:hypothetical protein